MSASEFWALTWDDWCLWVLRIVELQRRRKEDQELIIEMTRQFMSLFANAHFKGNASPTDFFKLSYDNAVSKDQAGKIDDPALLEEMKKRFKVKPRGANRTS